MTAVQQDAMSTLEAELREPVRRVGAAGLAADLLALTRPYQWPKNLLVVPLPLLHTGSWQWSSLAWLAWTVVAFTVASALVYVGNDIADRHRDWVHPTKRNRPVAAGRVSVPAAVSFAVVLAAALAGLLVAGPPALALPLGAYLVLNIAYSARLKHLPLLDVFIVAIGFQLRAVAGYFAVGRPASGWLLVCVLTLCLMFIIGKRRRELDLPDRSHRPALRGYSPALLDQLLVLSAALAVTAFLLSLHGDLSLGEYAGLAVLVSAPPALFGLFRYLQMVLVHAGGADPVRALLRDRVITATVAVWGVALAAVLFAAKTGL
jgi:decaprenyl-phosphate phosphoribosyltransferase